MVLLLFLKHNIVFFVFPQCRLMDLRACGCILCTFNIFCSGKSTPMVGPDGGGLAGARLVLARADWGFVVTKEFAHHRAT